MTDAASLRVRVSRKLLLVLTLVGALFLVVGLDVGVLHRVVSESAGADKPFAKWAFVAIAIGVGGAIALNCFLYFFVPPTLLRVTSNAITFGTGLRYKPFEIPCTLLESIDSYDAESMLRVNGKARIVDGGARFRFRQEPGIPRSLVTSMGAFYSDYELKISSTYAELSGREIAEAARRITGR